MSYGVEVEKAIAFAKENAGRRVSVSTDAYCSDDKNPATAIIIGTSSQFVVIEFEDPSNYHSHWDVDEFRPVIPGKSRGWRISVRYLTLIEEPIEKLIKAKLYSHLCKSCKSPARKSRGFLFCSNHKCKINKEVRNRYKAKAQLPKIYNKDYVLCPKCGNPAVGTMEETVWLNQNGVDVSSKYKYKYDIYKCRQLICIKKHDWIHTFKSGEKVAHSLISKDKDMVWP